MAHWLRTTLDVTYVGLVAALLLVGLGRLGIAAGPLVIVALAGLTGVAWLGRDALADVQPRLGIPLGRYFALTWAGPLLAIAVTLVGFDASAGELEALGGLVGLLAMLNYFLRPVYYALVAAGRRVTNAG